VPVRIFFYTLLISFFVVSCGTVSSFSSRSNNVDLKNVSSGDLIETGVASWYGPNFHGNLTANGEVYDMHEMTAAHRTLPFNTVLEVTNLDNGKSVRVRINDRGPYAKDRIIDLSKKAAEKLGMIDQGTANVSLYLLKGDLRNANISDLSTPTYTVQIASFQKKKKALFRSNEIPGSRVETVKSNNKTFYRVYYGVYQSESEARATLKDLQRQSIEGYVKQIQN
jgi:rare lipoprotein A